MLRHLRQINYGQAGVKACLLTFFQPEAEVFYTSASLELISVLGLSFQEGRSAFVEAQSNDLFSETKTSDTRGDLYVQVVNLSNPGLSADKRTLLANISQQRVHALVQDMEGQWWLYGQSRGLSLRYKGDTDAGLNISLQGMEREPARRVSVSLISSFLSFLN